MTRTPIHRWVALAAAALIALTGCSEPLTTRDVTAPRPTTTSTTAPTTTSVPSDLLRTADDADETAGDDETAVTPASVENEDGISAPVAIASTGFSIDQRALAVTLTADGSGPDPIWDFGDGNSGRGSPVTHEFDGAGDFTVTLSAEDGRTASRVVRAFDQPPVDDTTQQEPAVNIVTRGRRIDVSAASTNAPTEAGEGQPVVVFDEMTWEFGDGTTSRATAPTHVYERSGTYVVVLVAERADQRTVTSSPVTVADGLDSVTVRGLEVTSTEVASASEPLVPAFDMEILGNFVAVTNRSTGGPFAEITWDFGDGTSAEGRTASHRYEDVGRAVVTLYIRTSTAEAAIEQQLALAFDPPLVTRQRGAEVTLGFDETADVIEATWDFGDGSTDSGPVVTRIFDTPGQTSVTFTATAADGRSTTRTEDFQVKGPVAADFDVVTTDCATIRVIDRSDDVFTRRLWQFDDGETSTIQSPVHTFTESGPHTVTLQASNGAYEAMATADVTTTCDR